MTLTPYFTFGNIKAVESASFPLSRGVSPSVCTVSILPGVPLDRRPHAMVFGDGLRSVSFSQCIITDVSPQIGSDGYQTLSVSILDRRWKWRFGQVSGTYNIRRSGRIVEETRKSPKQLAKILFEAMGERKYDIRWMPDDIFPHIDWDLERPDAALDELCQQLGAHVVLRVDDFAAIYRDGVGLNLPPVPSSSENVGFDFGAIPGQVGIATAPFQWQLDLRLEPVGLDKDNKIKPINKLSYRPKRGWVNVADPESMIAVDEEYRKLAQLSVFRWYQLVPPKGLEKMPVTNLPLVSVKQLLPVLDHQLDYEELTVEQKVQSAAGKFDLDGRTRKGQQVFGVFYSKDGQSNNVEEFSDDLTSTYERADDGTLKKKASKLIYTGSFQVDNVRGIVQFGDPVYIINREHFFDPDKPALKYPDIRLRTAVNFRHPETRAAYRLEKKRPVPGGFDRSIVAWSTREDIIPEWNRRVKSDDKDNLKDVEKQLNYYLQYALTEFEAKNPASGSYPWCLPYSPDGRIAQVVYEIDGEGFIGTSIHRDIEGLLNILSYKERRREIARLATARKLSRQASQQDQRKERS